MPTLEQRKQARAGAQQTDSVGADGDLRMETEQSYG